MTSGDRAVDDPAALARAARLIRIALARAAARIAPKAGDDHAAT